MRRFQIHPHILAAFLQLAPLARIVQNTPGMIVNPTVFLLRWVFGTAAVAGSFHGLSGATGVVPSVVRATNGVRASVTFSITSPFHGTALSYSASGLPPGMTLSTRGTLSGTPTTSGSYTLKLRGWQTANQGGNWSDQNVAVSVVGAIPTAITLQPTSLTVAPSEAATFTATVTGDSPVALRWFREDLEVLNATNATLTLPKVQAADAGRYRLRVVSDLGTVFSDWATLTVKAAVVTSRKVGGKVEYYASAQGGVPEVSLSMTEGAIRSVLSGADGSYTIDGPEGPENVAVTLTPSLATDTPVANGVSTADITLIRRHVLGIAPLDSAYKVLAGDVNGSDTVTTADITLIRRLVLGLATNFNIGLWRFVPSDETFSDPTKPWTASRMRRYASLAAGTLSGQDFKAIKLGDVNGSWKAPTVGPSSTGGAKSKAKGKLRISEVSVAPGEVAAVSIHADGFPPVTSLQFSLRWDPKQLEFVGVDGFQLPGLAAGNFNVQGAQNGFLSLSWDPQTGLGADLATLVKLFDLRLKVLASAGSTAEVGWSDVPTPMEVTVDFAAVAADRVAGRVTVPGGPLVTPESLALRVVGPMVAGRMELEIRAPKGVTVSLEASVDLNTWNETQSLTGQGSAQPLTLTPAMAPEEGTRFWRLRVR